MDVKPVSRESYAEEIAGQLRRQILRGEIRPGERLPTERNLAAMFETNRNTLREALRLLDGLGLLRAKNRTGITVGDFQREGRSELISHFFEDNDLGPELIDRFADVCRLRTAVLADAAELAAERASPEERSELLSIVESMEWDRSDRRGWIPRDLEIFSRIVEASRSPVHRWMLNTLEPLWTLFPDLPPDARFPGGYGGAIKRMGTALVEGRSRAAGFALRTHFDRVDRSVVEALRDALGPA